MNIKEEFVALLSSRRGHFLLESGHHGELWLDLETLCLHPGRVRPFAVALAQQLAPHNLDAVCGPMNEGAFVAMMVAEELGVAFTYSERIEHPLKNTLYPVEYHVPPTLKQTLAGKRVAIINDVINAGSSVRGTYADLEPSGAEVVAIGTLLVLGSSGSFFAAEKGIAFEALVAERNPLWVEAACPLCAQGVPLEDVADFRHAAS